MDTDDRRWIRRCRGRVRRSRARCVLIWGYLALGWCRSPAACRGRWRALQVLLPEQGLHGMLSGLVLDREFVDWVDVVEA